MPRKKSQPKKAVEAKNSGTKRKTISPLDTAIVQDSAKDISARSTSSGVSCKDNGENGVNKNKRFHYSSQQHFAFDQNSIASMSYQQIPPYSSYMQSPPGYIQQIPTAPPSAQPNTVIPPWASAMMEEIKAIKTSVTKIDSVEKTVNIINTKFSDLELKVADIDKRVIEVEKACSFTNSGVESDRKDLDKAKTEIKQLEKSCKEYQSKIKSMNQEIQTVKDRMTDTESRSMRNNLIFYGLKEEADENCENLVKQFIIEKLGVNSSNFTFDRAHRMGNTHARKPRPVVARFNFYKEREAVRSKAFDMNDTLRSEGYGVSIQRPKNVRDARKHLLPIMQQEKRKGKNAKLVGDKLYINGELYVPSD